MLTQSARWPCIELFFAMHEEGVFTVPRARRKPEERDTHSHPRTAVLAFLLRNPVLLCWDDTNLQVRRFYKQTSGTLPSSRDILFRSRRTIEQELLQRLGHDDPARPVPRDANPVLLGLIRDGYIKSARLED